MGEHLVKYGFTPDYTQLIFHGEAHRMRDEVVRQCIDECDAAGGIGDMLDDYEGHISVKDRRRRSQRQLQRRFTRCWRQH